MKLFYQHLINHTVLNKKFFFLILLSLMAAFFLSDPTSLDTYAQNEEQFQAPPPKDLPDLTGDARADMLAIARSQIGYREKRSGGRQLSWFGSWADKSQDITGAPWCSEFAAWCVRKAGMPRELYPACISVYDARDALGKYGRVYTLKGGNPSSGAWTGSADSGEISLSELQPGDILLVRKKAAKAASPNHTVIAESVDLDKKIVHTIDGNVGKAPRHVARRKYHLHNIYAVVKPMYELCPETDILAFRYDMISTGEGRSVSPAYIIWKEREGVSGYYLLRAGTADGKYKKLASCPAAGDCAYTDKSAENGKTYYYKY